MKIHLPAFMHRRKSNRSSVSLQAMAGSVPNSGSVNLSPPLCSSMSPDPHHSLPSSDTSAWTDSPFHQKHEQILSISNKTLPTDHLYASSEAIISAGFPVMQDPYQELKEAFQRFDMNRDGKISATELGSVLRSLGDNPSDEELILMVKEVDRDGDVFIDLEEFIFLNSSSLSSSSSIESDQGLRDAF